MSSRMNRRDADGTSAVRRRPYDGPYPRTSCEANLGLNAVVGSSLTIGMPPQVRSRMHGIPACSPARSAMRQIDVGAPAERQFTWNFDVVIHHLARSALAPTSLPVVLVSGCSVCSGFCCCHEHGHWSWLHWCDVCSRMGQSSTLTALNAMVVVSDGSHVFAALLGLACVV